MPNKKDQLAEMLAQKRDQLDRKELRSGHEDRFLKKLNKEEEEVEQPKKFNWRSLSIAASIVLLLGMVYLFNKPSDPIVEQEAIPEEIAKAEMYFQGLINQDIAVLESSKDEHTKQLVEDAVSQLQKLEKEYEVLQQELVEQYDRRIIKAMISNFQTRINLLNQVLEQVEIIKQFKNEQHEDNTL